MTDLPWTPDNALNDLWSGLDLTATNGEVRAHLKRHLLTAYAAGVKESADPNLEATRDYIDRSPCTKA